MKKFIIVNLVFVFLLVGVFIIYSPRDLKAKDVYEYCCDRTGFPPECTEHNCCEGGYSQHDEEECWIICYDYTHTQTGSAECGII